MLKRIILLFPALLLPIILCGYTGKQDDTNKREVAPTVTPAQVEKHIIEVSLSDITPAATPNVESTEAPEKEIVAPTKEQVLAAREQALEGMPEEQIALLCEVVDNANYWWEARYLYGDIFSVLEDPNNLFWNRFNETGRIQIGWNCVGLDWERICAEENLTYTEFCEKYSDSDAITESWIDNEYKADDFIDVATTIMDYVQNNDLRTDIQFLIDEMVSCRDNHDVQAANNLFKMFHDMHYYLLNYSDLRSYDDEASIVAKYYGMLSVFSEGV